MSLALVNSIIKYAASSVLDADAWKVLVLTIDKYATVEQFDRATDEAEASFRRQTDNAPLPNAWRSAKSIARKAIRQSVPLTYGGLPRGKTAIVQDLNNSKPPAEERLITCPHCGGTFA